MTPAFDVLMTVPTYELIEEGGEPLETYWHRLAMNLLLEVLAVYYDGRDDYFAGGNMFLYFSADEKFNKDFRGPDFFYVNDVARRPMRRYWAVWLEGWRYPDVIIEILSVSTATFDRTTKKDIYERVFRTREYFCYDPDTHTFEGWRLQGGVYEPIVPAADGRVWCEQFGLWLGAWDGVFMGYPDRWPRFFDVNGDVVPTFAEAEHHTADIERERAEEANQLAEERFERARDAERRADAERQRADEKQRAADAERQRADAERQRADAEQRVADEERRRAAEAEQRATAERQAADEERRRAAALEAELNRLRALLPPPS